MSRYVQDSEWKTKYKNFRKEEFKCKCGKCDGYGKGIASSLLDALQKLRDKYGSINISSGYRCVEHNKRVGGSKGSKHMEGRACDFYLADGSLKSETKRKNIMKEIKSFYNYRYTYCNLNNSHPNMGSAIHMDFNFSEDTDVVKCKLTSGVWSRTSGYGFKYPKYKVIPKGTILEVITKNVGTSNGYKWDKVKWNGKTLYLPNSWSTYL